MEDKIEKRTKYYVRLGLNIALQRKLKKMTQAELADEVGISRTHLSNIEAMNSVKSVSLDVIFDIASVLEIEPDILFRMS
jgi:transcriptional regulator with XRE-family HTH domain